MSDFARGKSWPFFDKTIDPIPRNFTQTKGGLLTPVPELPSVYDGLISYFQFEESSGDRVDVFGRNVAQPKTDNVTLPGSRAGKVGNALDIERTDSQYLQCPENGSLAFGDEDFTIACWGLVESKVLGVNVFMSKLNRQPAGALDDEYSLVHRLATDRFRFQVSTDGTDFFAIEGNSFGAPALDTWYFIVAWHDSVANTINLQINNGTIDSLAHAGGVYGGTGNPVEFGRADFGPGNIVYLDGGVDMLGVWNRVLTASEKTFLYNSGNGRQLGL